MPTHLKDRLEKIELLLTKLTEESSKGTPIVVEGKKDAEALQELGVKGSIIMVKAGGKSFLEATMEIEKLSASEVILFLDFDRRGEEGTKRLMESLERGKIHVNVRHWRELRRLAGREIHCIEGLPSYLSTLQGKSK